MRSVIGHLARWIAWHAGSGGEAAPVRAAHITVVSTAVETSPD